MTTWKLSKNRGFYYGPDSDSPWNHDLMWKKRVDGETKSQQQFLLALAAKNAAGEGGAELPPVRAGSVCSMRSGSVMSTRSKTNLYKSAPSMLESKFQDTMDDNFSAYKDSGKESLLNALGRERMHSLQKEKDFVKMLKAEHAHRQQSDASIKRLEDKLNAIATNLHVDVPQPAPKSQYNNFAQAGKGRKKKKAKR